jgi:hypothetical protein
MSAGEFTESHGDRPIDEGRADKAEYGGRSGDFHGSTRTEEKSGTNGASDGDHSHLRGGKLVT